jgi:hypothetical protein
VEYLVQQQELSFNAAKTQAQQEVLALFDLELPQQATSESLNLTNNGILLAVSCILQGHLSTGDMSELMANIISDIRPDGTLDNPSLGSQLIDNARLVSTAAIRQNLEKKYAEPGMGNVSIPDFETYVKQFMDETAYEPKTFITYPASGKRGKNILSEEVNEVYTIHPNGNLYSMKAEMPEGTNLRIVLKGGTWYATSIPDPENWKVKSYDEANRLQEFTVTQSGIPNDMTIAFEAGEITVEYYENLATEPTRVKQIIAEGEVITPPDSTNLKSQSFYLP